MGSRKGIPNRRTLNAEMKAKELGIDPFECLLLFVKGDWEKLGYDSAKYVASIGEHGVVEKWTIDPAVRAKAAMEACNYLMPKRKAIEHTGEGGGAIALTLTDLVKSIAKDSGSESD